MSQATALYQFLYDWAKQVLITEAGLSISIIQSHQDIAYPSRDGTFVVIDFSPNRTKIGTYSAGDAGDLAAEHQIDKDFATTDVNIAADIITLTATELVDNDLVSFTTTDTLPAGLVVDTYYHVINKTTDTIQVSAAQGGATIDITDVGVGTHTIQIEGKRTLINDYEFTVELWEVNGTGETLRLLIDSVDRQDIKDIWNNARFVLRNQGEIQNIPRLPDNKWTKESLVELTIGVAEATLETSGIISDVEITGTIPAQGGSGDHTINI